MYLCLIFYIHRFIIMVKMFMYFDIRRSSELLPIAALLVSLKSQSQVGGEADRV